MPNLVDPQTFKNAEHSISALTSILNFKSFEEYKNQGGTLDQFALYHSLMERAKQKESSYITRMDMELSGIPQDHKGIEWLQKYAQLLYCAISVIFNRPVRTVSYSTFDLTEFNKLH